MLHLTQPQYKLCTARYCYSTGVHPSEASGAKHEEHESADSKIDQTVPENADILTFSLTYCHQQRYPF